VDRATILQEVREQFESAIWTLLQRLEETLVDYHAVRHVDTMDLRAAGSIINAALTNAALKCDLSKLGLTSTYNDNGQSRKLHGNIIISGKEIPVCLELHLCAFNGRTTKSKHQYASYDVEQEPKFSGFEERAPSSILLFVAYHLAPTMQSISRAYLKFADGLGSQKIEILRSAASIYSGKDTEPAVSATTIGPRISVKQKKKGEEENGSAPGERRNAASRS